MKMIVEVDDKVHENLKVFCIQNKITMGKLAAYLISNHEKLNVNYREIEKKKEPLNPIKKVDSDENLSEIDIFIKHNKCFMVDFFANFLEGDIRYCRGSIRFWKEFLPHKKTIELDTILFQELKTSNLVDLKITKIRHARNDRNCEEKLEWSNKSMVGSEPDFSITTEVQQDFMVNFYEITRSRSYMRNEGKHEWNSK